MTSKQNKEPKRRSTIISDQVSESFRRALENYSGLIMKEFSPQLETLARSIQPQLKQILAPFQEAMAKVREAEETAAREIGPSLQRAGFWIPPSSPASLISEIRQSVADGKSDPESIRGIFVRIYSEDDFDVLKYAVESCAGHAYFQHRAGVLDAALQAHMKSAYVLSIPALLPLLEGGLIRHLGTRFGRGMGGTVAMAKQAAEDAYINIMRAATTDAVIEYVTGIGVYGSVDPEYFHPDKYEDWLIQQGYDPLQVLNRHAILHGVQVNYASEENSLRAFLLVDMLTLIDSSP